MVAALAKGLLYGALLSASGAPLAAVFLRPSEALRDYALRVMRIAAVAAIALSLLIAALLFVRLGGGFDQPTFNAVFSSGSGAALLLQLTGAALLLTPAEAGNSGHVLAHNSRACHDSVGRIQRTCSGDKSSRRSAGDGARDCRIVVGRVALVVLQGMRQLRQATIWCGW